MANADFTRKASKVSKIDGRYIFADFSTGLYLLDTPRSIGEQLSSLALKGGRNVWTEYGALVPQHGYMIQGQLTDIERVVGISKDSKSSASVFILTMLGNIYHYSAYNGLKKYKSGFESIEDGVVFTRMNNNLVLYTGGAGSMFGSYYKESQYVDIASQVPVHNYGTYATLNIPYEYNDYFWRGKKIAIKDIGGFNITSIKKSTQKVKDVIPFANLANTLDWTLTGTISGDNVVTLDDSTGFKITSAISTHEGTTTTVTKKVKKYDCYKYEITDSGYKSIFNLLKFPTSGYFYCDSPTKIKGSCKFTDIHSSQTNQISDVKYDTWTTTLDGQHYEFKPKVSVMNGSNATGFSINDKSAGTMTRYSSGDLYTITTEQVTEPSYTTQKITLNMPLVGDVTLTFDSGDLSVGEYNWSIVNNKDDNTVTFKISSGETLSYSSTQNGGLLLCVDNNIDGEVTAGLCDYLDSTGTIRNEKMAGSIEATIIPYDEESKLENISTSTVSVGEQTILPIDLTYTPENDPSKTTTIIPKLLGSANNRLVIYDVTGNIYYSAVGVLDDFKEEDGAGYFGNFYNDTSECLDIEDYLNGILVTKQDGMYYVTISDTVTTGESGLNINKVSEIGQQYAGDHFIVGEKVYAYDSNSGSIVLACTQNMFGSVVAGKTLVPSEFIDSINLGISEMKRKFVYSNESNCFILYYGEHLNRGLVLTSTGSLFPRELDIEIFDCVKFNQGLLLVTREGLISQDFKKGTIILNKTPVAEFEAIGIKDNRCICSSILEVTELNGIEYNITIKNAGVSYQKIKPTINYGIDKVELPPFVYSDLGKKLDSGSFELETKWADKKSTLTRLYAPMSGRDGISISIEFAPNQSFCLSALRLPDFSQGE